MLRAVGIVEVEQRRLRKWIGRALVIRMLGVAVDFDGAELVGLDQQGQVDGREEEVGVEPSVV